MWNLTPLLSICVCFFTAWVVSVVSKPSNNKGSDIVLLSSVLLWCVLTLKGYLSAFGSVLWAVCPGCAQYQELQLPCFNRPHLVAFLLPSAFCRVCTKPCPAPLRNQASVDPVCLLASRSSFQSQLWSMFLEVPHVLLAHCFLHSASYYLSPSQHVQSC